MLLNRLADILFIVLAAVYVFVINYKPVANWDILPYMAITLQYSHDDKELIHQSVYELAKDAGDRDAIKRGAYGELITERIPYRTACYKDQEFFFSQLSYYRTKPLYTLSVAALYISGVPLVQATVIPSAIAAFFILLIVYFWLSRCIHKLLSFVLAASVVLLPSFSQLQNYSSPDALSNMAVLLSLFLPVMEKNRRLLLLTLAMAILIRIDNFIFASVILFFLYANTRKQILLTVLATVGLASLSIVILPYLLGNTVSWFSKFKFLESHVQYYFHVRNVFRAFWAVIDYQVWVAIGFAALFFIKGRVKQIVLLVIASCIIRLILFPSLQERFFVAYELALAILLITQAPVLKKILPQKQEYNIS